MARIHPNPPHLSKFKTRISPLLRLPLVRELILLPATLTGKRRSNKTFDYGVFQPSGVRRLGQHSLYVENLDRAIAWYERAAGLVLARRAAPEPHPFEPGTMLHCAYLSASDQPECLVLIERRNARNQVVETSDRGFFHIAFELAAGQTTFALAQQLRAQGYFVSYGPVKHNNAPGGDGETGGNVALYVYDADGHNIEFFYDMDTIENYRQRYGTRKGTERSGWTNAAPQA